MLKIAHVLYGLLRRLFSAQVSYDGIRIEQIKSDQIEHHAPRICWGFFTPKKIYKCILSAPAAFYSIGKMHVVDNSGEPGRTRTCNPLISADTQ
jgi:hypothetical protein